MVEQSTFKKTKVKYQQTPIKGIFMMETYIPPTDVFFDGVTLPCLDNHPQAAVRKMIIKGQKIHGSPEMGLDDRYSVDDVWIVDSIHPQSYPDFEFREKLIQRGLIQPNDHLRKLCYVFNTYYDYSEFIQDLFGKLQNWNFDCSNTADWRFIKLDTSKWNPIGKDGKPYSLKKLQMKIKANRWIAKYTEIFHKNTGMWSLEYSMLHYERCKLAYRVIDTWYGFLKFIKKIIQIGKFFVRCGRFVYTKLEKKDRKIANVA